MTVPQSTVGTMGTNRKRTVTLSADQVEAAKSIGISLEEYARLREMMRGDMFPESALRAAVGNKTLPDPNFSLEEINEAQDLIADLTKDSK